MQPPPPPEREGVEKYHLRERVNHKMSVLVELSFMY